LFKIDFEPVGRRGTCAGDQSLLECARQLNVDIVSVCGGQGSCGRCKVQIISGQVSKLGLDEEAELSEREVQDGYRMACRVYPLSDVKVHVPPESLTAIQRTQVEGLKVDVTPEPAIFSRDVALSVPSLEHPVPDDVNLWAALELAPGRIDFEVQRALSNLLRRFHWLVGVALRQDEIIAIAAPGTLWLGLAVDIGTTKIAGYLLDLRTGRTLASRGVMNPQISYGEDVITRIAAASKAPSDASRLQYVLSGALSQLAADLCAQVELDPHNIVDAVVVGNTAIHHLFLGLPVKQLGLAPYLPAASAAFDVKAREIGLKIAPGAYVHLLPNIAGYVGADHVAMLLATRMATAEKTTLAIDIGTNTEICLNHKGHLTSVSCASGPAFEGAHIHFGMRAAPGAIEHVRLSADRLEIQTIGGEPAVGICGSGLLDVIAQLRLNNILDRSGRMSAHARVQTRDGGGSEFVLAERRGQEPITVSQKDVREMQLAKAAIRLGIQALAAAEGIEETEIERVIIAGAFGTFIDVASAVTIGMLPPLPLERFEQVGNAAGTGARLALISLSQRAEARRIAAMDAYIELAAVPNFNRRFAEATYL
jgi:uncharacterized 2Fe-2S/4Fe-4S cluster protein (DUF4445 family)